MIQKTLARIKKEKPLIHAITNPISINQCANALLAVGCRPIMAEHPREVSEITGTSRALMINIGNITDVRIKSMMISGKTANKKFVPIVIDMVGISCSSFRRKFVKKLINSIHPAVIKGNYSEIKALFSGKYKSSGVDSEFLSRNNIEEISVKLALKYKTVVLASGKTDIITDGKKIIRVGNGIEKLTEITGTGCILGALCAAFLSVCRDVDAATMACAVLGISSELSESAGGNGSFKIDLINKLSLLTDDDVERNIKKEMILIEEEKTLFYN